MKWLTFFILLFFSLTNQQITIAQPPCYQYDVIADVNYCAGATTNPVNTTENGLPFHGTWFNNNTSIGLGDWGSGNIPSFTATNATNTQAVATVTLKNFVIPTSPVVINTLDRIVTYSNVSVNGGSNWAQVAPGSNVTMSLNYSVAFDYNSGYCPNCQVQLYGGIAGTNNSFYCNDNIFDGTTGAPSFSFTAPTTPGYYYISQAMSLQFDCIAEGIPNDPSKAFAVIFVGITNCPIVPTSYNITVNPTPDVNQPASQVVCNNSSTAAVNFTGAVTGTIFNWTNNATSIGLAASGIGNIASFTATNATNTPVVATVTVTPTTSPVDQSQTNAPTCIAQFSQTNLAQSFKPAANALCGARILTSSFGSGTGDITIQLYSNLPNAAGVLMAQGTVTGIGSNQWAQVSWSSVAVTPGTTYYLVFTSTNSSLCVAGSTIDPYPDGQLYANPGYGSFASYDYAFETFNCSADCTGPSKTFTYTVNPTPNAVATPASQTTCSAASISTIALSGAVSGTTYAWTRDNTASATGIAASGSGNISGSLTNTTSAPVTVTFTITPTANGCPGAAITATVLVNPTPNAVATPTSQTICSAAAISTIALSGALGGTTYGWTRDNTAAATGIAASGSGNISGTLTNTSNAPVTVTFTITPTANGCPGASITAAVIVNPTPDVNQPASQIVCNNTSTSPVSFTGAVSGTIFNWTNNTTSIGLPANGTGDIASFLATNPTNAPIVATVTVTPSTPGGGDIAYIPNLNTNDVSVVNLLTNTITATIPVGNAPEGVALNPDGSFVYVSNYNSASVSVINTTSNSVITTVGVGNQPYGLIVSTDGSKVFVPNSGNNNISVINTATNTVSGSFAVGSNPIGIVLSSDGTKGYVTNFSSNTVSVFNTATSTVTATITVGSAPWGLVLSPDGSKLYVTNTIGNSLSVINTATNILITTIPVGSEPRGIKVSADGLKVYVVNSSGNSISVVDGVSYNIITTIAVGSYPWTADITPDGTKLLVLNVSSNDVSIISIATNTVTGTFGGFNGPFSLGKFIKSNIPACTGASKTFTYTVNPTPNAVATPASQTICSAATISTIVLSGAVSGTTYAWTRDNTASVTGIAASGSGNISGSLTNTTSAPITVTFTITPSANGCSGAAITATVLVNPTPNSVATPASQTICSAATISTIVLSGAVSGTTYAWTRDNTASVTGITASGSGNISGALTNTTASPITVTFTITPSANGCPGTAITATVLVNPTPNAVATTPSQTICSGPITTIALSGAVSGTVFNWTRDNMATVTGIAASGSGNIFGSLTNTTSSPVTVTFTITPTANGCQGAAITATVIVNPTPSYTFTSNGLPYSEGDTITACHQDVLALAITSPVTVNYTFTRLSNGNVIETGSTPGSFNFTATNAKEGFYEIGITNGFGCILKDTIYLLVNTLPNPTATATPNPICQGGSLQLGVNGGNNFGYAWSGPNGFTSNVKNPTINGITPAGSGVYTVTVTNLNGCSNTSTISVLVNPTPTAIATPASQTICSATSISTIVLTGAVSGTTYAWTRNNTGTVTGIAASGSGNISGTLTNTTNAPVTVTFTITPTANSCPGAAITATVLVNPTPNAIATPASQTICSATAISTIVLTGAVSGTTYAWTRNNTATVTGIAASGSGNISGTLTNTTSAPVTVTFTITPTANGCVGLPITATVLVNPKPTAVATPASQTICSGFAITTITLTGTASGTTYTWIRNNTGTVTGMAASGSGNISGLLTNTTTAPITVTFTITPSANGCVGTPITATVLVNPSPVGTISVAPNPGCVGSTVQFSATGGTTYSWSGPLGWTSTQQNPTILLTTYLQGGKYEVTITNGTGCSIVLSTRLEVFYPPIATATYETSTACTGSTLLLHGTGAGSYSWSGPNGFTSNQQNPQIPNVTAANSGLYTLIVTSPNGCSATSTINITINTPPALSANPTLTQTCEGGKIQLFATGSGSFVWTGPATYTSTDQNPVIANIPIHLSGIYTVSLTASTGCISTASVEVKVYDQIHAFASASEDTICQGQSLQLHAEGGSNYLWNGPNGFNSNESDPRIDNITPKQSGKYYVYITNEGGCFGYAELTIVVKPSAKSSAYASPNPVNENTPVQFFASSNGVAYSWSGPLGFTSNVQNPSIKKVTRYMSGVYTVTITNENGCPSIVKVILKVLYTNKGGQTINGNDEGLSTRSEVTGTVYPNPTNDILYFDTQSAEAIEYVIYDVNGKVQVVQKTTSDRYISTSQLSSGIYQIRWKSKDSDKWIVSKFVKIR